jgi:PAS domain S-box-containing protein
MRRHRARFAPNPLRNPREPVMNETSSLELLQKELSQSRQRISSLEASLESLGAQNRSLRESEERFHLMVQAVRNYAIFMFDAGGRIVNWNEGAKIMTGYEENEVLGQHLSRFYPEEEVREGKPKQALEFATENGHVEQEGWRVRKDGTRFWADAIITALRDEKGNLKGFTKVARDITGLREMRLRLEHALSAKEVLLKEVHHRVRNNLQIISSLLRLESRSVREEPALRILNETQSRIHALAIIHELLYESKDMEHLNRREYITRIARHLYQSFGVGPDRIRLTMSADDVECPIKIAVPLGLIVNELVSNCLEHAFPGARSGEIRVSIEPVDENQSELVVADNGIGMSDDLEVSSAETFGLYLVNTLTEQLHGTMELNRSGGVKAKIRFRERE